MANSINLIHEYITKRNNLSWLGWDIIIVSVTNNDQAASHWDVLKEKYTLSEDQQRIKIIPDKHGLKIGSGGATIFILQCLYEEMGEELFSMRLLHIPGAGLSQRSPSCSALGKLFSLFPVRCANGMETMMDAWDLKLALTAPFSWSVPPGLFITCPDTLEPYRIENLTNLCFGEHFTAIAHPCSELNVASQHGVYVVDSIANRCCEVLQKPSEAVMRAAGAVYKDENTGIENVLIDSQFHFTHLVSRRLLEWAASHPVDCEIDAYGDFLQSLGCKATGQHCKDLRNVTQPVDEAALVERRRSLFEALRDFHLTLCILSDSKFFHLGSTREFLQHICHNEVFQEQLSISHATRITCSPQCNLQLDGCAMCCTFAGTQCYVAQGSVLEYCHFDCDVHVESGSFLSGCHAEDGESVHIPSGLLLQTIPLIDSVMSHVTILFGVNDNLKHKGDLASLNYCGRPLDTFLSHHGVKSNQVFSDEIHCLWQAKLFPIVEGPPYASLRMTLAILNGSKRLLDWPAKSLISMVDLLKRCDRKTMVQQRHQYHL